MSSMNFSSAKQSVKPPQRGIFPLDHYAECKPFMEVRTSFDFCRNSAVKDTYASSDSLLTLMRSFHLMQKYMSCLKEHQDKHHFCRDMSKEYLECRMDRDLMAKENLDQVSD